MGGLSGGLQVAGLEPDVFYSLIIIVVDLLLRT
jgi:hypothetical protein